MRIAISVHINRLAGAIDPDVSIQDGVVQSPSTTSGAPNPESTGQRFSTTGQAASALASGVVRMAASRIAGIFDFPSARDCLLGIATVSLTMLTRVPQAFQVLKGDVKAVPTQASAKSIRTLRKKPSRPLHPPGA